MGLVSNYCAKLDGTHIVGLHVSTRHIIYTRGIVVTIWVMGFLNFITALSAFLLDHQMFHLEIIHLIDLICNAFCPA